MSKSEDAATPSWWPRTKSSSYLEAFWQVPAADGAHDSPPNEPRKSPTEQQWQAVKEEIRVLYLDKGMSLQEVRKILERRYRDFRAT